MLLNGNNTARPIRSTTDLGALVKKRRKAQGLNQTTVAEHAGVGRRFLVELENGKPTAQIGKVLRVLSALGIGLTAIED